MMMMIAFTQAGPARNSQKNFGCQYFIYNLHKNTILYVTLHARKVTIEERKILETA